MQLQPKKLSNNALRIWRNFTLVDFGMFVLFMLIGFIVAFFALPKELNKNYKGLVLLGVWILLSFTLIWVNNYNARLYKVLWIALKYMLNRKKYLKTNGTAKHLVVYSDFRHGKYVEYYKGAFGTKRRFFGVLALQAKSPWELDESEQNTFLNRITDFFDAQSESFNLIRHRTLLDYATNKTKLLKHQNRKIKNIAREWDDQNGIFWFQGESVIDNYNDYYAYRLDDYNKLDMGLYVDSYFIVVHANSISELELQLEQTKNYFLNLNMEAEVLQDQNLVAFLAQHNLKPRSDKEILEFLDYQNKIELAKATKGEKVYERERLVSRRKEAKLARIKAKLNTKQTLTPNKALKEHKQMQADKAKEYESLQSFLAFDKVIFKKWYFYADNKYYALQMVNELPVQLAQAWWDPLLDNEAIININNDFVAEEGKARLLDRSMRNLEINADTHKSRYEQKKMNLEMEAVEHIETQMQLQGNALLNMKFLLLSQADNLKELKAKMNEIKKNARRAKIQLTPLYYRQFEAFAQYQIFNNRFLKDSIQITTQNFTNGWALENEVNNDHNTNLIGFSKTSGEPLIINNFFKGNARRTNYNGYVLGSSGKGKSTFVGKWILNTLSENNRVYVLDLQNEYQNLALEFGGSLIDLGTGKNTTINPLQVKIQFYDNDSEKIDLNTIINKHIIWLEGFFQLANNEFDTEQIMIISQCVKELYEEQGVYALKIDEFANFKFPILSDLIAKLKTLTFPEGIDQRRKELKKLAIIDTFEYLFTKNGKFAKMYNGQTNIDLNNDFIVFNTQYLVGSGNIDAALGLYTLLSFIQNKIYSNWIIDKNKNTLLVIDELHQYINTQNQTTLDFVYLMTKTVRKFQAGMLLCTQNPSDFLATETKSKKAEAILQNCQYSFIFGLRQNDLNAVNELFKDTGGLNQSTRAFLSDSDIGNALISLHAYSKIQAEIYYNDFEMKLLFKQGNFNTNS
ncbi:Mbov_0397 family ICE element conjugal transfer ATPase [Mycoplasmopsis columbinasalis]|uniref:Conjugal transfer ATP-binding protein TraC n=1 Tax=Mycoplasmopsis columbinasalis TaxID=114880 RepID=A0A449B9Q4_9BACT|nr:DUF87 domain-containing protein [Mycoplasmopsis columbinasalis]VEU77898.1 conjugal transfer ATP-binding protein TraC [Mycoplasmopsis columbinasalis]